MLPSFLISALAARYRASELPAFASDYPDAWLVWEAGPWRPAGKGKTGMLQKVGAIRPPTPVAEALATQLRIDARHPQVTLGRDDTCAIPINDATLSRTHLVLTRSFDAWRVEDCGSSNGSWLDDVRLSPGLPQPLKEGVAIQAGQVFLSYYEAAGMLARIKAVMGR